MEDNIHLQSSRLRNKLKLKSTEVISKFSTSVKADHLKRSTQDHHLKMFLTSSATQLPQAELETLQSSEETNEYVYESIFNEAVYNSISNSMKNQVPRHNL